MPVRLATLRAVVPVTAFVERDVDMQVVSFPNSLEPTWKLSLLPHQRPSYSLRFCDCALASAFSSVISRQCRVLGLSALVPKGVATASTAFADVVICNVLRQ